MKSCYAYLQCDMNQHTNIIYCEFQHSLQVIMNPVQVK